MDHDEALLLEVLNSAPVVDGRQTDSLEGTGAAALARAWGGTGTATEREQLRRARDAVQSVVRGDTAAAVDELTRIVDGTVRTPHGSVDELTRIVDGTVRTPHVSRDGVAWELRTDDPDHRLPVQVVLAWSDVSARLPGRLRACANDACNLFLVDHSRPGTAKWCSMATCGNRMKARAYAGRARG
ncbi:CGNR zinc finger domain-containing protein [Curtobacterium sp. 24E2]|nr:CGNR zinc finger domain-containing protein [Curtobacterium sp. 24E2]